MVTKNIGLLKEAKAWLKRKNGPDEIIRVVPEVKNNGERLNYYLYTAFDKNPEELGRILFDDEGYWIYDGELLTIAEQEQVARFIINYVEGV